MREVELLVIHGFLLLGFHLLSLTSLVVILSGKTKVSNENFCMLPPTRGKGKKKYSD